MKANFPIHLTMPGQIQSLTQIVHRAAPKTRYALALLAVFVFSWAAICSARAGLSRLLSEYGSATDSLVASKRALDFDADDPEAHYAHALALANAGRIEEAVAEFTHAVSLRRGDYFLWQELGNAREDCGDSDGAVAALRQAIKLAPAYAQPHWQLGNLLLRRNQPDAAFSEMRAAAASDPELFTMMADIASGFYDGDSESVKAATAPNNDANRISLARLFADRNQTNAALKMLRDIAKIDTEDQRALVDALIANEEFQAAHKVWSMGRVDARDGDLFDGGFESPINAAEKGFGWQPTRATQTVHILLDPNEPREGMRSLQLKYDGNFDPSVPVISQLLIVTPHTRYRLTFTVRTEELVSAGLPVVLVRDATGDRRVISQSTPISSGTNAWHKFSIEFDTSAASNAVTINIQRQACSSSPCPIVGRAWFDDFSIRVIT